jgi:hypothetical protein
MQVKRDQILFMTSFPNSYPTINPITSSIEPFFVVDAELSKSFAYDGDEYC